MNGHLHDRRARDPLRDLRGVLHGVRRSIWPSSTSVRRPAAATRGPAPARRRASRGRARSGRPGRRRRGRTGPSWRLRDRSRRGGDLLVALLGAGRARPGKRRLLARRGQEERVAVAAGPSLCWRCDKPVVSPSERTASRSNGAPSPRSAARIEPGSSARSVGFRSPASRIDSRSLWPIDRLVRLPEERTTLPCNAPLRSLAASRERSLWTLSVAPWQALGGAEVAQDAWRVGQRGALERVRALRQHDAVEDQRLDVVGVGGRVVLGDLGAVADAEERRACRSRPRRAAPRCRRRVSARAVEAAGGADLAGAALGELDDAAARRLSALQLSAPEAPVPRWSKSSRSRSASAGASTSAKSGRAAAPPGPGRRPAGRPRRGWGWSPPARAGPRG